MFVGGNRTADVVCTKELGGYEVSLSALERISQESSSLYGKLMRNLNVHLATRLVVATEIVRGLR